MRLPFGLALALMSTQAAAITLPLVSQGGQRQLSLKVAVVEGSGWDADSVTQQMNKVNRILSQCRVQFQNVEAVSLAFSPTVDGQGYMMSVGQELNLSGFRLPREPIMVFTGEMGGAFAPMAGTGGLSIPTLRMNGAPEMVRDSLENLVIIMAAARSPEMMARDYSPVAHELMHVLLNTSHTTFKNLMGDERSGVDATLTTGQCETLHSSPLLAQLAL